MGREARKRALERAQEPAPRLIFGLTKDQKRSSFVLSYLMAHVDGLKRRAKEKPGGKTSREYVMLDNLEEHLGRMLDFYRLERMHETDLKKAGKLFDALDDLMKEIMP